MLVQREGELIDGFDDGELVGETSQFEQDVHGSLWRDDQTNVALPTVGSVRCPTQQVDN